MMFDDSKQPEGRVADVGRLEEKPQNESRLLRKIDLHILPAVSILYLLSFLDRSNVGNARIEGLTTSIGITGNQYLTGLTIFFIGYVIAEVPFNIILKRTTPRFWLPTLTVIWGIVATLHGVTFNLGSYLAARFFLGVFESGLFPGITFYLSMWYRREERTFRIALFFSAASLAGAFGGILAFGIAHMKGVGGLEGWNWIFILEGIATVLVGVLAYFFITNYPATAKFLTESEKKAVKDRLGRRDDEPVQEDFAWDQVLAAFKDPKCWLYAAAFHTLSLPLYTLSLFFPTIIRSLGYTAAAAQLLTIPPYSLATILTVVIAITSQRLRLRAPFVMGSAVISVVGYIILLTNTHPTRHPRTSYAGVFLAAAGLYPATALSLSWPAMNVSGQTKRATAAAMQISIGNLGAVIGTQLYRPASSPRYVVGHSVALAYMCANLIVASTIWWYLARINKQKEQTRSSSEEDLRSTKEWKGDSEAVWKFIT